MGVFLDDTYGTTRADLISEGAEATAEVLRQSARYKMGQRLIEAAECLEAYAPDTATSLREVKRNGGWLNRMADLRDHCATRFPGVVEELGMSSPLERVEY